MGNAVHKSRAWDAIIKARSDERKGVAKWLHFCADATDQISSAELHEIANAVEQGVHGKLKW